MKLKNIIKESKTIQIEDDPCWKNYQQIGTKMKNGKEVPNCVPKNEVSENNISKLKKGQTYKLNGVGYMYLGKNSVGSHIFRKGDKSWVMDDDKLKSVLSEASSKSMPGQWVGYVETSKGDKLMGRFKSAMGAKQWLSKNSNKLLNTDGVNRVGIISLDEWDKYHAKWAIESVNEGARIVLVNPNTNKLTKTHLYSGPNRDADKEVEKLNSKLTPSQKDKGLYWKISTYESVNEGAGTLRIEKRKDGKYYWQYKFNSGKIEDWPNGFNTKADAQKDFMYRSKYLKETVNKKFGSKYDIGAGSMGNGTTFWNRKEEEFGDYKTIAHVSDSGKISWYDKKLPNDVKKHIEDYAKTKTESVNENCGCGSVKTSNPYSLSEFVITEKRTVQKIQKDYANVVEKMKVVLDKYKSSKGTPQEKKWVDELKKLTAMKKKYQAELDMSVQSLYADAEYEGE
jgi:hypothetical protein